MLNLARFGDVEFDLTTEEIMNHVLDVSEYPVEQGVNIVDHVKEQAITMSVSGAFHTKDSWQKLSRLLALKSEKEPQVYIGRTLMHNMVITNLSHNHTPQNRYGANFTMTLVNFKFAQKKRFGTNKQASQVEARTHKGRQQVKER